MKTKIKKPGITFNIQDSLNQHERALLEQVFLRVEVRLDQIVVDLNNVDLFRQPVVLRSKKHADEVKRQVKIVKQMVLYLEDDLLQLRLFDKAPESLEGLTYLQLWKRFFSFQVVELPLNRYDRELRWFGDLDLAQVVASRSGGDAVERVWREVGRLCNKEFGLWARIDRKVQRYLVQLDRELRACAQGKKA